MLYRIVYKSVAALLSLSIIPIAFFSPMIRIVGDVAFLDAYIGEAMSLYDIYVLFFAKGSTFEGFGDLTMSDAVKETLPALITSGSFLVAAILLAVITAVVAIFGRGKKGVLIMSIVTVLSIIAMFISFNAFAQPFVDGTIKVSDLGFIESGILNWLVGAVINVKVLQITSAGFLMIGCACAVLLWTLAFILIEIGDEPSKKKVK